MTALLGEALAPEHLALEDESHAHAVPKGAETHFKVVVVSARFEGLAQVRRHQLVYRALGDGFVGSKAGVHALAVTARTPAEWAASPEALTSPACLGGSKADG